MAAMAIARRVATSSAYRTPMATMNMRLWPEGREGHLELPLRPGDLVIIRLLRPDSDVAGPPGWMASEGMFWKVLDEGDGPLVKLTAPFGVQWDAEVWMLPAGSYSLPVTDAGSRAS